MKKILIFGTALCVALGAWADQPTDSIQGFQFTDVTIVPGTSVKDQNRSGTCWSFSSTAFMENEVLRIKGDSLDISEMYTVRKCYTDKADNYVRRYGIANFASGGSVLDVLYVWRKYGAMPEQVYPGLAYGEDKHVHGEVDDLLSAYVKQIVKKPNKKISTAWKQGFEGILDAYFGEEPETFTYNGKTYTPKTYVESLGINLDDYVPITSFTHHPYYESFVLEIPDNWTYDSYINVPLDEMKAIVDNAIANGYSVAWSADVSEEGFKWYEGVALMPQEKNANNLEGTELSRWVKLSDKDRRAATYDFKGPVAEIEVTPELRQSMYDNQETTDDHGMVIEGIATDQEGNRYYKVKNSWDTNQVYDGYIYVSEPYFLAKTLDILVHKDAIPKHIAKKMKIK